MCPFVRRDFGTPEEGNTNSDPARGPSHEEELQCLEQEWGSRVCGEQQKWTSDLERVNS